MGDLEDNEVSMLRREAVMEGYDEWFAFFEYKNEPRVTLISWLQFAWHCVRCDMATLIVKRGDHSYEADCEHVFDREGVDLGRAEDAQYAAHEAAMDLQYRRDCPYHLIPVPMIDWYRHWWDEGETEVLACRCKIVYPPERKPCPRCDKLADGTMIMRKMVKHFVTNQHQDPTAAYKLECGHSTIDL